MARTRRSIYLNILSAVVPYVRSVQAGSAWQRAHVDLYPELELVHGIYQLLYHEDIKNFDVYWIDTQGVNYANSCKRQMSPVSHAVLPLIRELIGLIPDDLMPLAGRDWAIFGMGDQLPRVTSAPGDGLPMAGQSADVQSPSAKQEIYLSILRSVLPYARNLQTHSWWRKFRQASWYWEMELLQDIWRVLEWEDVREEDVRWINVQCKLYAEACARGQTKLGNGLLRVIRELIELVPEELVPLLMVERGLFAPPAALP